MIGLDFSDCDCIDLVLICVPGYERVAICYALFSRLCFISDSDVVFGRPEFLDYHLEIGGGGSADEQGSLRFLACNKIA